MNPYGRRKTSQERRQRREYPRVEGPCVLVLARDLHRQRLRDWPGLLVENDGQENDNKDHQRNRADQPSACASPKQGGVRVICQSKTPIKVGAQDPCRASRLAVRATSIACITSATVWNDPNTTILSFSFARFLAAA